VQISAGENPRVTESDQFLSKMQSMMSKNGYSFGRENWPAEPSDALEMIRNIFSLLRKAIEAGLQNDCDVGKRFYDCCKTNQRRRIEI